MLSEFNCLHTTLPPEGWKCSEGAWLAKNVAVCCEHTTGRDGISRALYDTTRYRRVVVVRVFVKKTRRTPRREIELALKRAVEVK